MRRRDWIVRAAAAAAGAIVAPLRAEAPHRVTADGLWHVERDDGGRTLVLRDAAGAVQRRLPARTLDGRRDGTITALADLPRRRSLAVGFDGLDEVWEVSLDPAAPPIHDGLVHDYRMGEAIATPGFLGARRIPLPGRVLALLEGATAPQLLVLLDGTPPELHLVNLDVRRSLSRVALPGVSDLTAARWECTASLPRLWVPTDGSAQEGWVVEVRPTTLQASKGCPSCRRCGAAAS